MARSMFLVPALVGVALASGAAAAPPATPVITEPLFDGRIVNAEDVHMETGPFSDPDAGDSHLCSDWEIWSVTPNERVWAALCITGLERVHIHLGDGAFEGSHAGRSGLLPSANYTLRTRHRDSSGVVGSEWSAIAVRAFTTGPLSTVFALELDDVVNSPAPAWTDTTGVPLVLPGAAPQSRVRLETVSGTLLEIIGDTGASNQVVNPIALAAHGAARVVFTAGAAVLALPESNLSFTDNSGADRTIYLPAVSLSAGQAAYFWVSSNGGTYGGTAAQTQPDFSTLARGAPVPWTVSQAGYKVEVVATGFQLPLNIAFVPAPGALADDPYFYITELYGAIKVVKRDGTVGTYASGLINFDPTGDFPGSGEQGVSGIVVDPVSGDIFAAMLYDAAPPNGPHYPKVVRYHSNDGGRTAATQTIILNMVGESQGQSHQISNLSIGPDGKLYVHMGDGFSTATAQNLDSYRGKILRVNLNGTAPNDNPFYDAANGINSRDYVFAYGVRNPFGGAWRDADGMHYEVENGPSVDRFAQIVRGRNYLWNGSDASMMNFALYVWNPAHAPVNMAFVQASNFGGSGFPASKQGHAFVAESGPTWATGPQGQGKRITEFVLDAAGNLVSGPTDLVVYNGSGKASCVGLAAGPDGLYFTDLYKDVDFVSPIDPGANVLRVRFVGTADFTASVTTGPAPLTVQFTDTSNVPSPSAWSWSFGDGATSTQQNPSHTYMNDGLYSVRLSVTGASGPAVVQRNALIRVGQVPKVAIIGSTLPPPAGDAAAGDYLRGLGFDVTHLDDEPANRPSAAQIAAAYDAVIVSSTIASGNVAGEFRTTNLPMIFWENALLRTGREALMDSGVVSGGVTVINVTNNAHPVTQGLPLGATTVFSAGANMSVGQGNLGAGATVLATRSGAPADAAIIVANQGAALLSYTAPARRVFLFFEDSSFLSATPAARQVLSRSVCWSINGAPAVAAQPQPLTLGAGADALFEVTVTGAGPLTYQWRRNNVNLANSERISGATTRSLTIDPVQTGDAGFYDCVVTNACGAVTSTAAGLTVTPACGSADFNGDGDTGTDSDIEDFFACLGGSCCATCGTADFDGDGDTGTDADIEAFFRVLGGGTC